MNWKKIRLMRPTFVDWMAAAHVVDRPLSVTEWNVSPFPTPDRDTTPLYVASFASFQGLDALMQFAYTQGQLASPTLSGWSLTNWEGFNDPALMATMPAAALLYRRGDVQEAKTTYVFAPTPEQLFNQSISPNTSVALRTAVEKGKLVIAMPQTKELPWLEKSQIPSGAQLITDPNQSLIDPDATYAVSDTGELRRDWGQGTYTIDTPRSQAAMGWIGGKQINLADVSIAVTTRNATVAVQSLDQANISEVPQHFDFAGCEIHSEFAESNTLSLGTRRGSPNDPCARGTKAVQTTRVYVSSTRNAHSVRKWRISHRS